MSHRILLTALIFALSACSTFSSKQPVLYPNAHLQKVGADVAQQHINECMSLADNSGISKTNNQIMKKTAEGAAIGAATGAVRGGIRGKNIGENTLGGAAIGGTAGAIHGAFNSDMNRAYQGFVNECLKNRGFKVIGWQ